MQIFSLFNIVKLDKNTSFKVIDQELINKFHCSDSYEKRDSTYQLDFFLERSIGYSTFKIRPIGANYNGQKKVDAIKLKRFFPLVNKKELKRNSFGIIAQVMNIMKMEELLSEQYDLETMPIYTDKFTDEGKIFFPKSGFSCNELKSGNVTFSQYKAGWLNYARNKRIKHPQINQFLYGGFNEK